MRTTRAMHHIILLMLGIVVVCAAGPVFAAGVPTVNCSTDYVGLTNKIAGCIRETIDGGAAVFFADFYPLLQGIIATVMTLAVCIYGALMAMGMVEKIGRDTFMLAIKIGAVSWFCASSPLMYDYVTKAMDTASIAVVTYTPPSGTADAAGTDFGQSQCLQNMISMQANSSAHNPVTGPWLAMDCLIDTVIGIKPATSGPPPTLKWFNEKLDNPTPSKDNTGPARALLFFLFSGMQTSIVGMLLAAIGFIFIYGFIMVVVKALFTYLAGYMGIAFLIVISPLFIPLVLFASTKGYFDKWLKLLISFALQPVIMLVFIIFSLTAMDLAVFSGKYSIMYRIAGDESQAANFDLNVYLTSPRLQASPQTIDTGVPPLSTSKPIIIKAPKSVAQVKGSNGTGTPIPKDTAHPNDLGGLMSNMMYSECTKEKMDADVNVKKACGATYPIQVWAETIDWDLLASARTPAVALTNGATTAGQQISREVIAATLFCGVVVFILNGLLTVVPMVATDLMGDFGLSANLGGKAGQLPGAGAGGIANTVSNFKNKAEKMVSGR